MPGCWYKIAGIACIAHQSIIALREPDLEIIKANILVKIHDDYINNENNLACLMGSEIGKRSNMDDCTQEVLLRCMHVPSISAVRPIGPEKLV